MNKQFITKNFLLIIMLLAVAFAFAMKATVFQSGTASGTTIPAPTSVTTTATTSFAPSLTASKP